MKGWISFVVMLAVPAVSAAQTVKINGSKVEVETDGQTVVVDGDGTVVTTDSTVVTKQDGDDAEAGSVLGIGDRKSSELTTGAAVVCSGTNDVSVKDRHIEADIGVHVTGSCDVEISESLIEASVTGLQVSGSGDIEATKTTIKSSRNGVVINGSGDVELDGVVIEAPIAIFITGSGDVEVKNSKITGKIVIRGTGEFKDLGGNELVRKKATKKPKKKMPKKTDSRGILGQ